MIRKIYKGDYRGYEIPPTRRSGDEVTSLKYTRKSDRNQIKKYLIEDFHSKCAYCGWEYTSYADSFFHIEHTKNKDNHSELIDSYQYMALACPVCNCSKSNKEIDYFIDPIDIKFKNLFYRNKFGAIVSNNELTEEEKDISNQYIEMIGLHKELYKLDYVYGSLKKIIDCEINLEEKDYQFIGKITEIIEFINRVARRKTNYTDF
ncbi:HNH endonuclease [Enterococcus plantarum]|uniref:HNH endonuclease n=1 Tax=Enterococcus plantarum TaxID=1077675 RepID=UPI001A8BFEDF|nr:HNH endonuclease [Enterococcus plantarum]MBO0466668.1 HNH endonuclease [Enterococcus plantarum]